MKKQLSDHGGKTTEILLSVNSTFKPLYFIFDNTKDVRNHFIMS